MNSHELQRMDQRELLEECAHLFIGLVGEEGVSSEVQSLGFPGCGAKLLLPGLQALDGTPVSSILLV